MKGRIGVRYLRKEKNSYFFLDLQLITNPGDLQKHWCPGDPDPGFAIPVNAPVRVLIQTGVGFCLTDDPVPLGVLDGVICEEKSK